MAPRRSKSTKNPPIFSHEFLIQNHTDIVTCVAIVMIFGLMFQATSPVASMFISMQHNTTVNDSAGDETTMYTAGKKDIFTVFFYFLIAIVGHSVIQENILDKMNRKLHLSKVKHSKFNESGQLVVFYLWSFLWGANIIAREEYVSDISLLWAGYPQDQAVLSFSLKFFFLVQIAYWLHCFPELYFQKVKKEEMMGRVQYITLYTLFIAIAYALNFSRVAVCLLVLHYAVEIVFHAARLSYFFEKSNVAAKLFMVFNVLFVMVRLETITLAVLTFWYGLEKASQSSVDMATGYLNTKLVRIICLAAVSLIQAWMMWNFITFQLRRLRERSGASKKPRSPAKKNKPQPKAVAGGDDDYNSLPEVDQNSAGTENGAVRLRSKAKKAAH